jgi:hypothetical protein
MRRLSKEEAAAEAEEEEEGAAEKEEEEGAAAVSAARCSPGSRRKPIDLSSQDTLGTKRSIVSSTADGFNADQCRTIQYDIIYQCSKLNHTQRFVLSNSDGSEVAWRGLYGTGPFWVDLSYTYCISESH